MSFAKDYMSKIQEEGYNCSVDKCVCKDCIGNDAIKQYINENAKNIIVVVVVRRIKQYTFQRL